jgi:hypothetical protein
MRPQQSEGRGISPPFDVKRFLQLFTVDAGGDFVFKSFMIALSLMIMVYSRKKRWL